MGIERIGNKLDIPDFSALCPECHGYTVHIHNLKCGICDNKEIIWCPTCKQHYRVTL